MSKQLKKSDSRLKANSGSALDQSTFSESMGSHDSFIDIGDEAESIPEITSSEQLYLYYTSKKSNQTHLESLE